MPDNDNQSDSPQFEIPEEEFNAAVSPPDCKGRINLRIEQTLMQEIEDIAEDHRYPLNSVSEVVRYCCLNGLQRLRQWKPSPTLLGAIKAANALMIRDKLQCEAVELLERLNERVHWYIAHGHYDEVIGLVAQVRSYFEALPQDFWSDHIKQEIDNRFIDWLSIIDERRSAE